ncbi:MAG: hypothetical protein HOK30_25220 [Rhodospirillaceae bacterium]|jgi:catechol 2,3-dioxygenase-like lactoylglutathione lyase family enzyme|nr:hypothetical protein [Rhodospirillaceae bacterium]MBT5194460.1 hypothetical protein [Rhodospirillaceae bacterium]MBT5895264.1 hypothetical protein [Rhodospirillaceae bacterium]MBT6430993.1 hypothetical protein [Rhodospirillaceae bacterium]MBT7758431.1 hypothetical protein [Rhodospirillaceae bacterium]
MPISHLEHFLIVADDMEATAAWYVDILGFQVGEAPDFGTPVKWLYLGDGAGDVIHIAPARDGGEAKRSPASREEIARGGRPIHHIAFRANGLSDTLAHLRARDIEFVEQQAGSQNLYQGFLADPNGITVELNFPAAEAVGLEAPKLALRLGQEE